MRPIVLAAWVLVLLAGGCAGVQDRRDQAFRLVADAGWSSAVLPSGTFDLFAAWPAALSAETLVIYIEGDGFAYQRPTRPSSDPTPTDPVALRMALAASGTGPAAYLARPCQYVMDGHRRNCATAYWTGRRYAPEVVESAGLAVDQIKRRTGARRLVLVGYSGGGALAVLVAARRNDLSGLVTVAANLDLGYWTRRDHLAPLSGSLDPADFGRQLGLLPQLHLAGGRDDTVGPDVARAYIDRLAADAPVQLLEIPGFSHACCWAEQWPALLRRPEFDHVLARR